jgi:uncharacterized repeat protein (TIGR03803 family)
MIKLRILAALALVGLSSRQCVAITATNITPYILYAFGGPDGATPEAGLIQGTDGSLYGTTSQGGANDTGTVFRITTAGALTTLYSFTGGADGATPEANLIQGANGNFYGTTFLGGTNAVGTIFQITSNGVFTTLHSFMGADGSYPLAGLIQGSNGNFYGTTSAGGANGTGTVFQVTSAGTLTTLYNFTGGADGATPKAGLVQGTDGNFYGTTFLGGTNNDGTVFLITPAGALTTLYQFNFRVDGRNPKAALVQGLDGSFYGTTETNGARGVGMLFSITSVSSTGVFSLVFGFGGTDGKYPQSALIQGQDGYFYGTTTFGGFNYGSVFQVSSNGLFTTLYNFIGGTDGGIPYAGLVQGSDGYFYGTTGYGGLNLHGTVFRISAFPVGEYTGLAVQTNAPSAPSSGYLDLNLRIEGSFTANLTMGGVRSAFQGQFDVSGNATNTVMPNSPNPLQVIMHLNESGGSNEISGTVSDGVFTSQLLADLGASFATTIFDTTNRCPVAGRFTFVLPPADINDTTVPQGYGYGILKVSRSGRGSLQGVLGDGTAFRASGPISILNTFALYDAIYPNKHGAFLGRLSFPTTNTVVATLDWFKPPVPSDRLYPAGFTTSVGFTGAQYLSPSHGVPSIAGTAQLTLGGGNLGSNIVKSVVIAANGAVTVSPVGSDQLALAIQPGTGQLRGIFLNTDINKVTTFNGLLLQDDNFAGGLFLGDTKSGFITLVPDP